MIFAPEMVYSWFKTKTYLLLDEILPLGEEYEIAPLKNTSCQIAQQQWDKLGNFLPPRMQ